MQDAAVLGIKVDSSQVRRATGDLDRFGREGRNAEGSARRMGSAVGKAVAAFGGIALSGATLGRFVRTVGSFESSMSKVAAISGATNAELAALRETAKTMGATTRFSASQAADGLGYLAMAGFTAAEAMDAMPGVLSMAAAGGLDLANAADIASNVLSGFGMEASEAARVSDVLAKAAASSNTSIEQLGGAMSYAAPAAAAIGEEVEITAAAIGVLSDAGIQGQRAGVAVANVMSRMVSPTKAARDALENLGLTAEDVNVEQLGLKEVMDTLSESGIGLAEANELVGFEMGKALLVMIEAADKMGLYEEALLNAEGAAKGMSTTISDNLDGDLQQLNSAIEGLIINIGETGATGGLRSLVQGITDLVRAAGEWEHLDKVVMALGGIAVAAAALVFPVASAVAALTAGAIYVGTHWEDLGNRFPGIVGSIEAALPTMTDVVRSEVERVKGAFGGILTAIENTILSLQAVFAGDWSLAWEKAKDAVRGFIQFARDFNLINVLTDAIRWGASALGEALSNLFTNTIAPAVRSWADRMVARGRDLVDGINRGISAASSAVSAALASIWETIKTTVSGWSDGLVQTGRDLIDGFTRGIREKLGSVGEAVSGAADSAVGTIKSLLGIQSPSKVFRRIGEDTMAGYVEGVGAMADDVANSVKEAMDGAIDEAEKAERELKARADRIIDSFSNNILKGNGDLTDVWDDIKSAGVDAFTGILKESFAPGGEGIKGVIGGLSNAFKGVMSGLSAGGLSGIMSAVSSALPIIGAVVGAINLIKGFHTSETVAKGVSGRISGRSRVNDFEVIQHKWLWGLITTIEEVETANRSLTEIVQKQAKTVRESIIELADTIGASATDLSKIALKFKIDAKGMSADEVKSALSDQIEAYGDMVAEAVIGSEEFLRAGESYLDALKRMAEALPTVNAALETMGHTMFEISLVGADAASAVAELFGGVQNFAQSANFVFERFYREGERVELLTAKLTREMGNLGLAMPETRDEFRRLLQAQNLMTEGGRQAYAALMQMAGSFDAILPKFDEVAGSIEAATNLLETTLDETINLARNAANEARRAANEFERLFEAITEGARDLRREAMPEQQSFRSMQRDFRGLLASAMSGDTEALGDLPGAASNLQTAFAAVASSREQFQLFSSRLSGQLLGAADVADELSEAKSVEAQSLDALIYSLENDELTHDLLRHQIEVLESVGGGIVGMTTAVVSKLTDLRSALTGVDEAEQNARQEAAESAAAAASSQLAQIVQEASRVKGQLQDNDIPDRVRITQSKGVWLGASYALTSDGRRFEERGMFNTSKELEAALNKARSYVNRMNDRRDDALARERALTNQLDRLRDQVRSLGGTPSFAGGGFTGMGARSGGLDGQGGFAAMLHPRETVIDHTRHPMHDPELVREMRATRREIAAFRDEQRQLGVQSLRHTRKTSQNIDKWDQIGLPQEQT